MQFGVALALSAILSTSAWSLCGEPRPRLVCAEYFHSNVVVSAKLVRTQPVLGKDGELSANIYHMETLQTLRGAISSEFQVFEGNDSGRAGFFWKNGNSYLLFLFPSREKKGAYWGLDGCGNSGPLKQNEPVLNEIRALSGRRGGSIEVGVGLGIGEVQGAKVSATGNGTSYSALTDQHGRSVFHVPSGRYYIKVTGDPPHEPYFLSYEQPNVTIENGACAQIQFEEAVKQR